MFPLRVLAVVVFVTGITAFAEAQTPQAMTVTSPTLRSGETIPQDYTADGKNVSFTMTTTGAYLWTFTGTFTDKDTLSGTLNYHDASHDINGTWNATRTSAAAAAPLPGTQTEMKTDR